MKTQCTIETSDSVRTLIALALTGELRLASREEVRKYMELRMLWEVDSLEDMVSQMRTAYAPQFPEADIKV